MGKVRPDDRADEKFKTTLPADDAVELGSGEDPNLERATYASPPCFMHELDPSYLGYLSRNETLALLNELLEGVRAGARSTGVMSENATSLVIQALLRDIRSDEARFCAMLGRQIERLGGVPSRATGACCEKAIALGASSGPLAMLDRSQRWVARRLRAGLSRIGDDDLRAGLGDMLAVLERNIECIERFAT